MLIVNNAMKYNATTIRIKWNFNTCGYSDSIIQEYAVE